jgi:hypothetical protein
MKSFLIIFVFLIVAIAVSAGSLSYWNFQRNSLIDRTYPAIDELSYFSSQNSDFSDSIVVSKDKIRVIDDPDDPYGQKLRDTLSKYNVSRQEWETNTGNAWTYKWEIIKELNQWQMENN